MAEVSSANLVLLFVPVITMTLALIFRKLEQTVAGSAYWKDKQTNNWIILAAWSIFYFYFILDCRILFTLPEGVCTQINPVLFVVLSIAALYASYQWYLLSKKNLGILKKYRL